MSSSNQRRNKAEIERFRKELHAMLDDVVDIDKKILNKAVNKGLRAAKNLTNVSAGGNLVEFDTRDGRHVEFTTRHTRVGGLMRKSWRSAPAVKRKNGAVTKSLVNTADYSSFVNYGHRIVQGGVTKGWVKGQFILEKAIKETERAMIKEFKSEIARIERENDN